MAMNNEKEEEEADVEEETDEQTDHSVPGIFPNRSRGGYNKVLGRLS